MGPGTLKDVLKTIETVHDPRLLVSGDTMDDAGVFQLSEEMALVQTVDFFTPMVDDPYLFGHGHVDSRCRACGRPRRQGAE